MKRDLDKGLKTERKPKVSLEAERKLQILQDMKDEMDKMMPDPSPRVAAEKSRKK